MKKLFSIMTIIAVLGLFVIGCENNQNPIEHQSSMVFGNTGTAKITIPYGATMESATFYIYAGVASGKTVDLQRVTNDWDEYAVTWNNFGAAYTSDIYGSFISDVIGWKSTDITSLVQEWIDGTYDNFGFVMIQNEDMSPYSIYNSRENANFKPYLEICFTTDAGVFCETTLPIADAYIWKYYLDYNGGTSSSLYTGWISAAEKQSLVKFELETIPTQTLDGCTLTIGFWKTHAGFGPQDDVLSQYLPISLGTDGEAKTMVVTDAAMAVDILKMKTYGTSKNSITKLYAQLLGAKLNMAAGADYSAIADALAEADAFLADHDWNDWDEDDIDENAYILSLKDIFDDYNNGDIGPGHCDDFGDDD